MNIENIAEDTSSLKEMFWKCLNAIVIFNNANENLIVKVGQKATSLIEVGCQELYYDTDSKSLDFGYVINNNNEYHIVTNKEKQNVLNVFKYVEYKLNMANNRQKKNH